MSAPDGWTGVDQDELSTWKDDLCHSIEANIVSAFIMSSLDISRGSRANYRKALWPAVVITGLLVVIREDNVFHTLNGDEDRFVELIDEWISNFVDVLPNLKPV